ncbi:hypothetical protein BpHYR1_004915 [Brachionus plicatilis]|uniref:Uncharacterized protein n=1 Tax=Brachionus plicatilis TaxID=10195 RepID=A0A3M7QZB7_BRAPC|nr:hypothetical protein BpHYR1_004915 [Brachionus plicatilis]
MSTVDLNETPLENSYYSDEDTFHKVSTPYMQKKAKAWSKKKWQFLDKTDCLFLNSDNLNQIKLVETCLWNHKNNRTNNFESFFDKKDEGNFLPAEVVLDILSKSKCRKKIYDYFQLIQFHNCCTLLTNFYKPSDCDINICIVEDSNEEESDQIEKIAHGKNILFHFFVKTLNSVFQPIDEEELHDQKLVLYYCTICSLYPNLYTANQSSPIESCSSKSDISLSDSDTLNESGGLLRGYMTNFAEDLETTSEGLCDHIRELFSLKRQVFNEYQVKAMKRLLLKKSHPQLQGFTLNCRMSCLKGHCEFWNQEQKQKILK